MTYAYLIVANHEMVAVEPGWRLLAINTLADLLSVTAGNRSVHTTAANRIRQWSADFAILDVKANRTLLVIELDDRTHSRPDRKRRDIHLNEVLAAAGIPIVRFKLRQSIAIGAQLDQAKMEAAVRPGIARPRSAAAA